MHQDKSILDQGVREIEVRAIFALSDVTPSLGRTHNMCLIYFYVLSNCVEYFCHPVFFYKTNVFQLVRLSNVHFLLIDKTAMQCSHGLMRVHFVYNQTV